MNAPISTFEAMLDLDDLKTLIDGMTLAELLADVKSPGYPDRVGSYQYTHRGSIFFPCDPRPEEVFIEDIAHGVASLHRFGGQTLRRMTVAEHLYICSFMGPRETALERLMHDGAEPYIGDVIRPLKVIPLFGAIYLKIESGIERAIAARYHLQYPYPPCVRIADEAVCHAEVAQNIGSTAINHLVDHTIAKSETPFFFWAPDLAEKMFLYRFLELAEERGIEPF